MHKGVQGGAEKETESSFKEMTEKSPNLGREMNIQVH